MLHAYEIRPRKDRRGVDLISDALPFGRLWYGEAATRYIIPLLNDAVVPAPCADGPLLAFREQVLRLSV
jgi:hypothetical protein